MNLQAPLRIYYRRPQSALLKERNQKQNSRVSSSNDLHESYQQPINTSQYGRKLSSYRVQCINIKSRAQSHQSNEKLEQNYVDISGTSLRSRNDFIRTRVKAKDQDIMANIAKTVTLPTRTQRQQSESKKIQTSSSFLLRTKVKKQLLPKKQKDWTFDWSDTQEDQKSKPPSTRRKESQRNVRLDFLNSMQKQNGYGEEDGNNGTSTIMDSNLCQNLILDNFDSDELESIERKIQSGISTTNLLQEVQQQSQSIKPLYIEDFEIDESQIELQSQNQIEDSIRYPPPKPFNPYLFLGQIVKIQRFFKNRIIYNQYLANKMKKDLCTLRQFVSQVGNTYLFVKIFFSQNLKKIQSYNMNLKKPLRDYSLENFFYPVQDINESNFNNIFTLSDGGELQLIASFVVHYNWLVRSIIKFQRAYRKFILEEQENRSDAKYRQKLQQAKKHIHIPFQTVKAIGQVQYLYRMKQIKEKQQIRKLQTKYDWQRRFIIKLEDRFLFITLYSLDYQLWLKSIDLNKRVELRPLQIFNEIFPIVKINEENFSDIFQFNHRKEFIIYNEHLMRQYKWRLICRKPKHYLHKKATKIQRAYKSFCFREYIQFRIQQKQKRIVESHQGRHLVVKSVQTEAQGNLAILVYSKLEFNDLLGTYYVFVNARPIDHQYRKLNIQEYKQTVFTTTEMHELNPIVKQMSAAAQIETNKHQQKHISTTPVEQIQGHMMRKWLYIEGQTKRDPTLDGRRVLNRKIFRPKWFKSNQSEFSYTSPYPEAEIAFTNKINSISAIVTLQVGLHRYLVKKRKRQSHFQTDLVSNLKRALTFPCQTNYVGEQSIFQQFLHQDFYHQYDDEIDLETTQLEIPKIPIQKEDSPQSETVIQIQSQIRVKKSQDYFPQLLFSKTGLSTKDILESMKVQSIILYHNTIKNDLCSCEWLMVFPSNDMVITFQSLINYKLRLMYRIKTAQIESRHIKDVLAGDTQKIIKFFKGPIELTISYLEFNQDLSSNWETIDFQDVTKRYFVNKLGYIFKTYLARRELTFKVKQRKNYIVIRRAFHRYNGSSCQVNYLYLTKQQQLRIIIFPTGRNQMKRTFVIDLLSIRDYFGRSYMSNPTVHIADDIYFKIILGERVLFQTWYKNLFKDFVYVLDNHLYLNRMMKVQFKGAFKDIKPSEILDQTEDEQQSHHLTWDLAQKVIKVQSVFKSLLKTEWFSLVKKNKLLRADQDKTRGLLVKRSFYVVDNKYYILSIYSKQRLNELDQELEDVNIILNPFRWNGKQIRKLASIQHRREMKQGQISFYDYVVGQLIIVNDKIMFRSRMDELDYLPVTILNNNFLIIKDSEQDVSTEIETSRESPHMPNYGNRASIFMRGSGSLQMKQSFNMTDSINMSGSITGNQSEQNKPKKVLVHNITQFKNDGSTIMFDVVYSNKTQERINEENLIQIQVDLEKLITLYPNIDRTNDQVLRDVADQIVNGITCQNGQVLVDKNIIKPSLCRITNNTITKSLSVNKQQTFGQQYKEESQILLKKSQLYQDRKFIITISYVEQQIPSIIKKQKDDIFITCKEFYRVVGAQQASTFRIDWEITPNEMSKIIKKDGHRNTAMYLINRIVILEETFLFVTKKRGDQYHFKDTRNVIFMNQRAFITIQRKFKSKLSNKNYVKYRQSLQKYRDRSGQLDQSVIVFSSSNLNSLKTFIILCVEDHNRKITFKCWDLLDFKDYTLEFDKRKHYKHLIEEQRKRCFLRFICEKHLSFDIPRESLFIREFDEQEIIQAYKLQTKTSFSSDLERNKRYFQ